MSARRRGGIRAEFGAEVRRSIGGVSAEEGEAWRGRKRAGVG